MILSIEWAPWTTPSPTTFCPLLSLYQYSSNYAFVCLYVCLSLSFLASFILYSFSCSFYFVFILRTWFLSRPHFPSLPPISSFYMSLFICVRLSMYRFILSVFPPISQSFSFFSFSFFHYLL